MNTSRRISARLRPMLSLREGAVMSDDPIELNDNSVAHGDDLTSSASAQEADVQPRPVRAAGGRFRAGQSGNPRGRPRKAPEPFFEMVARVLNEPVSLTLRGQRVEISCAEAIIRAMCHGAMKDPRLGKEILKYAAAREAAGGPGGMEAGLVQSEAVIENYRARVRRQVMAEVSASAAVSSGASDNDNPGPLAGLEEMS